MKIAIISHTEHYRTADGTIVGWGPTILEINNLLNVVDSIVHIAPLHNQKAPESALSYNSDSIKFIALKESGGKGLEKLSILATAPYNLKKISAGIKDVDFVQFRAPTGMGIYVLPFLKYFNRKKYWAKYAGNWVDSGMPLGNKIQKFWLKHCVSTENKVTVNGHWKNERKNIIPFENPCLSAADRILGKEITEQKFFEEKKTFCFVGALNNHKGVSKILKALKELKKIDSESTKTFHFVGDGPLRVDYEEMAMECDVNCVFHGFLQKQEIQKIYSKSHFIVLPSKSEGFPKVIGEAMNFGCIPIVSDVSCIGQYITDNINGFLLENLKNETIMHKLGLAIHLNQENYLKWIQNNFNLAEKFTYSYYNNRLIKEIFN